MTRHWHAQSFPLLIARSCRFAEDDVVSGAGSDHWLNSQDVSRIQQLVDGASWLQSRNARWLAMSFCAPAAAVWHAACNTRATATLCRLWRPAGGQPAARFAGDRKGGR
jgi:hypothetical protein